MRQFKVVFKSILDNGEYYTLDKEAKVLRENYCRYITSINDLNVVEKMNLLFQYEEMNNKIEKLKTII